jgi:hypothetical protein
LPQFPVLWGSKMYSITDYDKYIYKLLHIWLGWDETRCTSSTLIRYSSNLIFTVFQHSMKTESCLFSAISKQCLVKKTIEIFL